MSLSRGFPRGIFMRFWRVAFMFSSCFIPSLKGNVRLVSVSCGSQNVWAVDHRGIVYFRVGTQPLNPSMMLPAWIHIEPPAQVRDAMSRWKHLDPAPSPSVLVTVTSCLQPVGVQLVTIQTSPNDHFLWAIDNRGTVFVRTGLCEEMPVGTAWEMVPGVGPIPSPLCRCDGVVVDALLCGVCTSGLAVSQLVISSWTVWVRCINGDLARRYGVTVRNPAGDYWKKIPGQANCLTGEIVLVLVRQKRHLDPVSGGFDSCVFPRVPSVTPEDELWAVTVCGGLSRRLTKVLPQTCRSAQAGSSLSGDDEEWELI